MLPIIRVNSDDKHGLVAALSAAMGHPVEFSNGCSLTLEAVDGLYWGTNPYGNDWACNARPDFSENVAGWLEFWDAPRGESGVLLQRNRIEEGL
ncbi:hypothetical protein ACLHZ0_21440 [Aeromonas salmonicida]|uniref:hypothetical protein n=1 Tax=Aeromonas salmonicida TaxID=645 RepID=UPI003CFEC167